MTFYTWEVNFDQLFLDNNEDNFTSLNAACSFLEFLQAAPSGFDWDRKCKTQVIEYELKRVTIAISGG